MSQDEFIDVGEYLAAFRSWRGCWHCEINPGEFWPLRSSLPDSAEFVIVRITDQDSLVAGYRVFASRRIPGYRGESLSPEAAEEKAAIWLNCRYRSEITTNIPAGVYTPVGRAS